MYFNDLFDAGVLMEDGENINTVCAVISFDSFYCVTYLTSYHDDIFQ